MTLYYWAIIAGSSQWWKGRSSQHRQLWHRWASVLTNLSHGHSGTNELKRRSGERSTYSPVSGLSRENHTFRLIYSRSQRNIQMWIKTPKRSCYSVQCTKWHDGADQYERSVAFRMDIFITINQFLCPRAGRTTVRVVTALCDTRQRQMFSTGTRRDNNSSLTLSWWVKEHLIWSPVHRINLTFANLLWEFVSGPIWSHWPRLWGFPAENESLLSMVVWNCKFFVI